MMFPRIARTVSSSLGVGLALFALSSRAAGSPAPHIRFLDVDSASEGSFVGIYGRGFGTDKAAVRIGATAVSDISLWTDGLIIVRVPDGAQTGLVEVDIKGGPTLLSSQSVQRWGPSDGTLKVHVGRVWVVSPKGKDTTTTGDESDPFQTIGHALSVARQGDTILIRAGTYNEEHMGPPAPAVSVQVQAGDTTDTPTTIRGWAEEIPVVQGSGQGSQDNPILYIASNEVRIARLAIDGSGNQSAGVAVQSRGVWLAGVEVSKFGTTGIFIGDGMANKVLGSHVHDGSGKTGQGHGVVMSGAGGIIADNVIDAIPNGYGLLLQYQTQSSTIVSANEIHDTAGAGIGISRVFGGNQIYNNKVWRTGQSQGCLCAIEVGYGATTNEGAGAPDLVFYNTFAGPARAAMRLAARSGSVEVHENIFADFQSGFEVMDDTTKTALRSSRNLWFRAEGPIHFRWGEQLFDTGSFRTVSGQEQGSLEADPLVVDLANGNLQLTSSSPACDNGGGPDSPDDDYNGVIRPQGSDKDWGAFEYNGEDAGVVDSGRDGQADGAGLEGGADAKAPEAGDGSLPDGAGADSSVDDGATHGEAGTEPGGNNPASSDKGCGCSTPATSRPLALSWIVAIGAIVLGRRKRAFRSPIVKLQADLGRSDRL